MHLCRVTQALGSVSQEGLITPTSEKTPPSSSLRLYLEGPQLRMDDSGICLHILVKYKDFVLT